jgi:serine/threonine-protein kinase
VGLSISGTSESFSDTVPSGVVISQSAPEGALRPGGSIALNLSKGEDLVDVPNVLGMTIAEAAAKLQSLGFGVTSNVDNLNYWTKLSVESQNPTGGQRVKRGSTVAINNS